MEERGLDLESEELGEFWVHPFLNSDCGQIS